MVLDLRYAHLHGRWYIWDGKHWAEDVTAEVERRAKRTVRAMYRGPTRHKPAGHALCLMRYLRRAA
jgi:hypothetical protein